MKCRYCRFNTVSYNPDTLYWECATCHLSSRNKETMTADQGIPLGSFDDFPLEDVVIEATLDHRGEPVGFVERYVPPSTNVPNLTINVERARFWRHLLKDIKSEEKRQGDKWLKSQGYKNTKVVTDNKGRKLYVWEKDS